MNKKDEMNELIKLCEMEYKERKLVVPMGKINDKENVYMDFTNVSGLFIAGATGTGKSVFIDDLIFFLKHKNSPSEIKLVLLDPKKIELGEYDGSKYVFNGKSESDALKGYNLLINILQILKDRVSILQKTKHQTITDYNLHSKEKWPHIFIFIDEGCEIMKIKDAVKLFEEILEFGKIVGFHLIFATNSYLKDYVNNEFINKFKYRMTFDLASTEQAEYIDIPGSNWLKANGKALIPDYRGKIYEFQAPYISNDLIKKSMS